MHTKYLSMMLDLLRYQALHVALGFQLPRFLPVINVGETWIITLTTETIQTVLSADKLVYYLPIVLGITL